MQWHHDACRDAGIAVQMIGGIPYFYRRFGYGYGLEDASLFLFDRAHVDAVPAPAFAVRRATPDDLAAILRLEAERPTERPACGPRRTGVASSSRACATTTTGPTSSSPRTTTASPDGYGSSTIRTRAEPSCCRRWRGRHDAVTALVRAALDRAGDNMLIGFDSPGTDLRRPTASARRSPFVYGLGYYVRIPDPIAFLELLRPVLSRRLAASDLADGDAARSRSRSTRTASPSTTRTARSPPCARSPVSRTRPTSTASAWRPTGSPRSRFGRWKATDLAKRVDDVLVLRDHHLMNVLFPFRTSDVSGDF